jgi:hypothetical protein
MNVSVSVQDDGYVAHVQLQVLDVLVKGLSGVLEMPDQETPNAARERHSHRSPDQGSNP